MATPTETLKERIRVLYHTPVASMDAPAQEQLAALRTQLLCRGYAAARGKRGGVVFSYVGVVRDDDPAWKEVDRP